VSSRLN